MLPYLERLYSVLTDASQKDLHQYIPPDNIGSSVRQNAKWPCLEFGISEVPRTTKPGKRVIANSIRIYSTNGETECWEIATALEPIMIPRILTDKDAGFKVDKVRCTDTQAETDVFSEWRARLEVEYTIWISQMDYIKQT